MANIKKTPIKAKKLNVRIPHILVDARQASPELLDALTPGLKYLHAHFTVLGDKNTRLKKAFSAEEGVEGADMWVVLGDQLPAEFEMITRNGTVPVIRQGIIRDAVEFNPVKEEGNSFLFEEVNEWTVYAALVRAIENYGFPYDWKNLQNEVKNWA